MVRMLEHLPFEGAGFFSLREDRILGGATGRSSPIAMRRS